MKTKSSIYQLILVAVLSIIISINTNAQSKSVLSSYLEIKDALVKTDSKAASTAAKDLTELIKSRTDELSKKITDNAIKISESKDVSVQRKSFVFLSVDVYTMIQSSSDREGPVYKQYCPMAKAYWLAVETEINIPYFGDKMLHCGSVQEKL